MNETDAVPGGAAGGKGDGWGWTPPMAWVALTMLLSVRGLYSMAPIAWDAALPAEVAAYVHAGMGVAVVNILWGAWLLAAARSRSRALRRGFLAWQSFHLVALAASAGYTFLIAGFVTTTFGLLVPAVEFVVGAGLIVYALRLPDVPAAGGRASPSPPPASVGRYILNAVIGGVLGAFVGGIAGFPFGVLLAELLDISCFEGGCGYFAALIGILLILAGFIIGVVIGVVRTGRTVRAPAA